MPAKTFSGRFGKPVVFAFALAAFGAMAVPPAQAASQPYLGWDFGGGFGIGLGTPPSAYDPCPTYGWPVYPYGCRYAYYYRPIRHHRYSRHYRQYHGY